jgi:hypothetical protein
MPPTITPPASMTVMRRDRIQTLGESSVTPGWEWTSTRAFDYVGVRVRIESDFCMQRLDFLENIEIIFFRSLRNCDFKNTLLSLKVKLLRKRKPDVDLLNMILDRSRSQSFCCCIFTTQLLPTATAHVLKESSEFRNALRMTH